MHEGFASLIEDMSRELSTLKSDARTLDSDERESVDNDIATTEAELAIAMGVQKTARSEPGPVTIQEQIASLKIENEILKRTLEEIRRVETDITALRMKDQRLAYKLQLLLLRERILDLEFRILSHDSESWVEPDDPSEPTCSVSISLEDPSELTEYLGFEPEGPEGENPEDEKSQDENPDDRNAWLSRLPPQEEKVVRMRFGIGCEREHCCEEIATACGLTADEVQKIEATALRRLRTGRYEAKEGSRESTT
jgi:DNA-directed RNA polymerase specialized sigma24 family protein